MEGCLRCSGRAVPYSGGGVTPITLTPNFTFPQDASGLSNQTMTASAPISMDDLVNGLVFIQNGTIEWHVVLDTSTNLYHLSNGSQTENEVQLSSDGLTITFGSSINHGQPFTGFTFNA